MVLEKEQFIELIKNKVGEDTSKEAIEFLENVTDTYNDLVSKIESAGEYTKEKYEELDKAWAKKYKDRFFEGTKEPAEKQAEEKKEEEPAEVEITNFEELFEEVK